MPFAPARPCRGALTARRCRVLVTTPDGWCPACKAVEQRQRDDAPVRRRAHTFYKSAAWQRCRAFVIRRDPICVLCGVNWSKVADHYPLPLRWFLDRGLDKEAADPANSRGLCWRCSNSISGQEAQRRKKGDYKQ